jgi:hypothetical protein
LLTGEELPVPPEELAWVVLVEPASPESGKNREKD